MLLTFANKITVCRILAVPFFISSVLSYTPQKDNLRFIALGIFLFAVITDFIDGYVARTRHQKTKAGAILDPLADKMLLISAYSCLFKISSSFHSFEMPIWLVVTVISRDMVLLIGAMIIYMVNNNLEIEPTKWGKATTFFQIIPVIGILIQWNFTIIFWPFTFFFTIISGVDYIWKGIKVINNSSEKQAGLIS